MGSTSAQVAAVRLASGTTPSARARIPRAFLLLFPAALLGACLSVVSPRPGKPVEIGAGKALVFGRVRVTAESGRELLVFSRDPMEHVIPPDPVFTLELREIHPPGGAVKYGSNPSPQVEEDGSFHWILKQGDYVLASNPRAYGSSRFDPGETTVLARFTVPRGAGTVNLGTLQVVLQFGWLEGWKGNEPTYTIVGLSVTDDSVQAFTRLRARYPSVPEPGVTAPMVPEQL
jgi:hypothetical protein